MPGTVEPLDGPIELDDVTVRFGDRIALDSVSLTYQPGQAVAMIGPNGSGKTTILRLVAGLLEPTTGTVTRPGNAVFGYVSQHASHSNWLPLTVHDVIRMGRYRHRGLLGRLSEEDRAIVTSAAAELEVTDLADQSYGTLSGGQRQRVRIAQALATEPNVLILDEPITGLDLPSQEIIIDLIERQAAQGTAVLVTTHHLDEARHCDRVVLVAKRVVASGPPPEVLVPALLREAFGQRVLGEHRDHDHSHEMLLIDDHGHSH